MSIKLTEHQKFLILQAVSGDFLTENYPDNWEDLSEAEQDQFLADNAWEPFENMGTDDVANIIDNAKCNIVRMLESDNFSKEPVLESPSHPDLGYAYDELNIIAEEDGQFSVKTTTYDGYPAHSVLAGQPCIKFVDTCETLEEAQEKYPTATCSHNLLMAQNTVDHLPDEPDC